MVEKNKKKKKKKKKKKVNQTKKKDKIIKNKKDSFSAKLKAPISNTNPINIKLQM